MSAPFLRAVWWEYQIAPGPTASISLEGSLTPSGSLTKMPILSFIGSLRPSAVLLTSAFFFTVISGASKVAAGVRFLMLKVKGRIR